METKRDRTLGFILASVLTGYPDDGFQGFLQPLWEDPGLDSACEVGTPSWSALRAGIRGLVNESEAIELLRSDYIDLFDRSKDANPLYETEYGRDRALAKGQELADIAAFYRAFGLELDRDGLGRDMLDHVSIQLEFYSLLLMKQARLSEFGDAEGSEIVFNARKSYLRDHLGRFVGAVAERPGVTGHAIYSAVFNWVRDLVAEECTSLDVRPAITGFISGQVAKEEMGCGGGIGCGAAPGGPQ